MGWSSSCSTLHLTLRELRAPKTCRTKTGEMWQRETLRSTFRGNIRFIGCFWAVEEITRTQANGDSVKHRLLMCYRLERRSENGVSTWWYKDMCESEHPFYYTCPIGYLAMVPEPGDEHSRKWRQNVREHYESLKASRDRRAAARRFERHYV